MASRHANLHTHSARRMCLYLYTLSPHRGAPRCRRCCSLSWHSCGCFSSIMFDFVSLFFCFDFCRVFAIFPLGAGGPPRLHTIGSCHRSTGRMGAGGIGNVPARFLGPAFVPGAPAPSSPSFPFDACGFVLQVLSCSSTRRWTSPSCSSLK